MVRLDREPTVEALHEANIIDLRDWLAEHFDDAATTVLAPLGGWPLVEIGPDEQRACGLVILVRGVGTIRVALRVEVAQEDDDELTRDRAAGPLVQAGLGINAGRWV